MSDKTPTIKYLVLLKNLVHVVCPVNHYVLNVFNTFVLNLYYKIRMYFVVYGLLATEIMGTVLKLQMQFPGSRERAALDTVVNAGVCTYTETKQDPHVLPMLPVNKNEHYREFHSCSSTDESSLCV